MGVWGARSKTNTSNWKELRTIQEALEQEVGKDRVRHHTVFYFPDNLVSYYVIQGGSSRTPALQKLVLRIKELEQELGCHFEVVHVPGTMMIWQGTDGLSRGLWMSPERRPMGINQKLFDPVPYSPELGRWAAAQLGWTEWAHHVSTKPPCLGPKRFPKPFNHMDPFP